MAAAAEREDERAGRPGGRRVAPPMPWWLFAALPVAVVIAWANAFPGTFQFDDYAVIVDNPAVQRWTAFVASMPGIRPLLKASYTFSWTVGGGAPTAFVAFNVAVHAANAVLVMLLARRVLALAAPELRPRTGIAVATALLFALHPAQTEAVTWIAGRATSLSAGFVLASVLLWLAGADAADVGDAARARRRRSAAMAVFAAALAVKETAATLPFALLLLEALRRVVRDPANHAQAAAPARPWRDALRATAPPFVLLALAAAAAWSVPTYRRLVAASLDTRGPFANLAAQVDAIAYLVTDPLLRLRVNIDPEVPLTAFGPQWWLAAAALAAVALVAAAGLSARPAARPPAAWRSPLVGFALAWFLLHLAPTNSLLARFDLANDRQLYLALLGPALLVAAALPAWRARRGRRVARVQPAALGQQAARELQAAPGQEMRRPSTGPAAGVFALVPAALLAAVFGAATIARNRDYATEIALWEATVRAAPSKARAWNNLGYAYEQAGRRADARSAYERALSLDPDQYKARSNLHLLDDP